jgi:hypothetical protein
MSQHDKSDMAIPADEATNFVLSKPQSFAGFKIILNAPSGSDCLYHLLECCPTGAQDKVVGLACGVIDASANEQPMASIILPPMQDGDTGPIEEPWACGAIAHREPLPILDLEQKRLDLAHFDEPTSSVGGSYPNRLLVSDGKHIPVPMSLEPEA